MDRHKERYISSLEQRLARFYISVRDYNATDNEARSAIEAYMEAGIIGGIVTKGELEEAIDRQHTSIFGMSLTERYECIKEDAQTKGNYEFFDRPAWMRQGIKVPILS